MWFRLDPMVQRSPPTRQRGYGIQEPRPDQIHGVLISGSDRPVPAAGMPSGLVMTGRGLLKYWR